MSTGLVGGRGEFGGVWGDFRWHAFRGKVCCGRLMLVFSIEGRARVAYEKIFVWRKYCRCTTDARPRKLPLKKLSRSFLV
jgi:hypothetical protein